jgi:hypothetical protein
VHASLNATTAQHGLLRNTLIMPIVLHTLCAQRKRMIWKKKKCAKTAKQTKMKNPKIVKINSCPRGLGSGLPPRPPHPRARGFFFKISALFHPFPFFLNSFPFSSGSHSRRILIFDSYF